MVGLMFLGGVNVFGLGGYLGGLAGFCVDCNIDFGLPLFRAAPRFVLTYGAQPHAARVRSWPWAKLNIARALTIEEVTEDHDRAAKEVF
jgi:hypothetical protein